MHDVVGQALEAVDVAPRSLPRAEIRGELVRRGRQRLDELARWHVVDAASRNGTLVNGVAVKEHWLRHGDEIATGDSVFLFLVEEDDRVLPASRVEFDDRKPTAETRIINPKDIVYLQPDRLLRELPSSSPLARNLSALLKISRVVHAIRDLEELQAQLLDLIFEVVPAGRGAICKRSSSRSAALHRFQIPSSLARFP